VLIQEIRETVARESKVVKDSLRWAKTLGLGILAQGVVAARSA
jgi:hypothetical protein